MSSMSSLGFSARPDANLERAVRTVVSVPTAFFLELRVELLPAAASDGFLFSSENVVILIACSGRGAGLAGAFLVSFGAARAGAG
uniref:Cyclin IaZm n=1 Tax=Arundo donax TaxID=35708 RepID=A0A0A9DAU0_ARUDO